MWVNTKMSLDKWSPKGIKDTPREIANVLIETFEHSILQTKYNKIQYSRRKLFYYC